MNILPGLPVKQICAYNGMNALELQDKAVA